MESQEFGLDPKLRFQLEPVYLPYPLYEDNDFIFSVGTAAE
jgi:hypothetical protein